MFSTLALYFAGASTSLELYLNYRQKNKYAEQNVPLELKDVIEQKTYNDSRLYNLDKLSFGSYKQLFTLLKKIILVKALLLPLAWSYSSTLYANVLGSPPSEIPQTMVFVALLLVSYAIIDLPWDFYYHFVVEEKHGFNRQTVSFFLKDQLKSFALSVLLIQMLVPVLVYVIKQGGQYFFFYVWGLLLAFSLVLITVYPEYIAPLFDKYEPLRESTLKDKIEALSQSIGFPLTKLLVVRGSKRSSHSNAYFYGFFKNKRIVLFDTILPEEYHDIEPAAESASIIKEETSPIVEKEKHLCDEEEVVAILSHELGHWKFNHVLKNFAIAQVDTLISFALFGTLMNNKAIFESFGFYNETPVFIGMLLIFEILFEPINEVKAFGITYLTRVFEYQADAYAHGLGNGNKLKSALVKIHKSNLGNLNPDHIYSLFKFSHPTLIERLRAIDHLESTTSTSHIKKD